MSCITFPAVSVKSPVASDDYLTGKKGVFSASSKDIKFYDKGFHPGILCSISYLDFVKGVWEAVKESCPEEEQDRLIHKGSTSKEVLEILEKYRLAARRLRVSIAEKSVTLPNYLDIGQGEIINLEALTDILKKKWTILLSTFKTWSPNWVLEIEENPLALSQDEEVRKQAMVIHRLTAIILREVGNVYCTNIKLIAVSKAGDPNNFPFFKDLFLLSGIHITTKADLFQNPFYRIVLKG